MARMAMAQWQGAVFEANGSDMDADKRRWRLHAVANMEMDLQAWYHAVFSKEVRTCADMHEHTRSYIRIREHAYWQYPYLPSLPYPLP